MYTVSLTDGESQSLADQGMLKIQVFPVGTGTTDLRLTVAGDGVRCLNPNPALAVVTDIPATATVTVTRDSGGDFPIDQSVRVTVTRGTEVCVEFPIVRVGGVAEKLLGRAVHDGGDYVFTAFGSADTADLPGTVMAVASTLRAHLTGTPQISRIHLMVDSGATFDRTVSADDLTAAVTVARGIAGTLGIGTVDLTTGRGHRGDVPCGSLDATVRNEVRTDTARVGADVLPAAASLPADELAVYLTATPVSGMYGTGAPSVVVLCGTHAAAERDLAVLDPDLPPRTGVTALTRELADAVNAGDGAAFSGAAAVIAAALTPAAEVLR